MAHDSPPKQDTVPFFPCQRSVSAFSLIEVAAALAIFSFALAALLGLLSVAFQTTRDSLELGASRQLADKLSTHLNRIGFNRLKGKAGLEPTQFYFSDLGEELPNAEGAVYEGSVALDQSESANLLRAVIAIHPSGGREGTRRFCYLILNNE